ncbi:DUF2989 domain-containing protein [Vibrio algarum]|uniref:DUF2989 domain-containing protein n=1 Tax=Vibrio algarum TaxID=3020714 RepID=A0ABT4YP97_9VIBR|nr:DUF2989 domain-containing protein [Vibrio sp. KJ40-1]MDB1123382.1 DUF2989 domain-containing protein [Vibrio sp. KJ40-1]
MKTKNNIVLLSSCLVLFGCFEGRINTNKLCDKNPDLRCDQLNMDDGQCRVNRTDLIWHRKETLESPTDSNMIQEFHFVKAYHKCLQLAAQIEPSKTGDKKEKRFNALLHSIDEEKRLLAELSTHDSPEALYFLWTQGQQSAIRKFLQLEKSGKLNTAELQYALATYYITRDREKTVNLLNNALKLSDEETLNIEILEALASVNHALKRSERAYVWVIVSKEFGVPVASERDLTVLYNFSSEKKEQLEEVAEEIIDAIEDNNYKTSLINKVPKSTS